MPGKVFNPIKGVFSFNGRKGLVIPQTGDYTAEMVGAAPEGFGLGTNNPTQLTTIEVVDAFLKSGWAQVYFNDGNNIGGSRLGTLISSAGDRCVQHTFFFYYALYGAVELRRQWYYDDQQWRPWEWVNPPMLLGVEYRTIERYNGKPVYTRLVDVGPFPSPGTCKEVSIETGHSSVELVSCSFKSGQWEIPTTMLGGSRDDIGIVEAYGRASASKLIVYLYTKQRDLSSINATAYFKYTVEDS